MKKILLGIMMLVAFQSRATNFTLVMATVDTAYAHYNLQLGVVDTDLALITRLGARPTYPTYDSTAAQWNAYVSSVNTYDSTLAVYQNNFATHKSTLDGYELTLLQSIGYGTTLSNPPALTWIKVSGNNFSSAWIGYYLDRGPHIVILYSQPTQAFPQY